MAYLPAEIGSSGLVIPDYPDILAYLIAQFQLIYGSSTYLAAESPDYQDLSIRGLQASYVNQALQLVYLSFNPQTALGTALDLCGRLIGTAREAATYSTALVTLTGTPGTIITNGTVRDVNGNYWNLGSPATIGSGGTVIIQATAQQTGNITANPGDISLIITPTAGWTQVTNATAASTGLPVESDANYRARLLISQAKPSLSLRAGTAAAIAAVPGVTRSVVYENPFDYTATFGFCDTADSGGSPPETNVVVLLTGYPFDSSQEGKQLVIEEESSSPPNEYLTVASVIDADELTLTTAPGTNTSVGFYIGDGLSLGPPHSITCVVEGGASTAIAEAIYNNRGIGCYTNGGTSAVVIDPSNASISMTIRFDVLVYAPISVTLDIHPLTGYTSAVQAAIVSGVVDYLNSLGIGESVVYSELFGAALTARPNPDQPLFSIRSITFGAIASPPNAEGTTDVPINYNAAASGNADDVVINIV